MLRRMKRLLRLRNKSGFTLVEVIVACALLGVLVLGIMGFATPVLSGVRTKEQNARAVLLSEAIDTYIANTTKYAYYVQTISLATSSDTAGASPKAVSLKFSCDPSDYRYADYHGKGLEDLKQMLTKPLNKEDFEIRCIGMRWMEIPGENGAKKLMLTNEKVDQDSLELTKTEPVFDSVFYDGMYPVLRLENYARVKDSSVTGGYRDPVDTDPQSELEMVMGLKISTDVYLSDECYSTDDDTREDATMTVSGMTYADFTILRNPIQNQTKTYMIQPDIAANMDYSAACIADGAADEDFYYPNTFIYYIVRKNKTAGLY